MAALVKAGDWTRPCVACGKRPPEVEFDAQRRSEKAYRRGECRGCKSDRLGVERYSDPDQSDTKAGDWSRPCSDCGKCPPDVEFGVSARRKNRLYRKSYCVECQRARVKEHDRKNPEQAKARESRRCPHRRRASHRKRRNKRWQEDPDNYRREIKNRNIRYKFGISLEDYEFRFEMQGGICGICDSEITLDYQDRTKRTGVLDHCHETGQIRSFLCESCNAMIGMAKERISTLIAGAEYLEVYHGSR